MDEVDTRKHAKFLRNFSDYAEQYGFTDRAIRRWVRVGKQLGDVPPLDVPAEMAGWWGRCMKHRVPDSLLQCVATAPPVTLQPPPDVAGANPPPPPCLEPRDFSKIQGLDLRANVETLRHTHAINAHLLNEAFKGQDENLIALRQRNFKESFTLLRVGETSLVEVEKQLGHLIDKESVRAELAQVFESQRLMRETMRDRIVIELEKLLPSRFRRIMRVLAAFLTPAIEKARADEENIFRHLESFDSPEAIRLQLAA